MHSKPAPVVTTASVIAILLGVGTSLASVACSPSTAPAPPATPASAESAAAEAAPRSSPAPTSDLRAERIPIRFSDVDRVEGALKDILDLNQVEDGAVRTLLVDHDTNEIIVLGTPAGIELVRTILGPALVEVDPAARDVVVLRLSHRHPNDVARALASVAAPDVVLVPDSSANALVVRARPEDRAKIAAWVREIDVAPVAP
jgi:type II secretory pathway component GspD/PulD (secretin)